MKFRKLTALFLVLCMMLSLGVSAFAAEKTPTGYLTWMLDDSGTLSISGNGRIAAFTSAEDQPWHEMRENITSVKFDPGAHMVVPDVAYWFAGCINLKSCVLPSFANLGADAFKDCANLNRLQLHYNDDSFYISDTAFSGVDMSALEIVTCDEVTMGILDAKGLAFVAAYPVLMISSGACGVSGCNCSSCSFTYDYEQKDESKHYVWECCTNCSANEYAYRHTQSHSFNSSGVCTKCGYEEDATCQHDNTYTSWDGCDWEEICRDCGEVVDWGTSHGSYSYGDWEYYSTSQHRRYGTCDDCGGGGKYQYGRHSTSTQYYEYDDTKHSVEKHCSICNSDVGSSTTQSHSLKYGSWENDSDTQHRRSASCSLCGYSGYTYANHSFKYGTWANFSDSQHRRTKSCATCSTSDYEYAGHSFTYGKWSSVSDTQHKRTKTCSVCKASGEEYADHVDANGDGKCDDCGANVALIVTWDAASNGGTVGGKNSVTTSVAPNQTAVAPGYTPVKAGHTFSGWYTEKTNGTLYSTVTITAARTFYAQFAPAEYQITWDLGTGKTETTDQTYGEKLNLPTEPTRKGYAFLGWFTQETGGTQVDGNTVFKEVASTTYYAHWEEATVFSVVVPAVLPVTVDQNGKVYVSNAEIVNHSTAAVQVSSVTLTAENGWTLVPYASDMSHAKVDSNQIGFSIRDQKTTKTGDSEVFTLSSPWQIAEEESLTLSYDAVVSALSQPVTNANILSVLFVVEWA
jgi:uncharacterized repeat protein (TIGR02543 family)